MYNSIQDKKRRKEELRKEYEENNNNKGLLSLDQCRSLVGEFTQLVKKWREKYGIPPIKVGGGNKDKGYYVIVFSTSKAMKWDSVNNSIQRIFMNNFFKNGDGVKTIYYVQGGINDRYGIVIPYYNSLQETIFKIVKRVIAEMYKR